ncbi:MAG: histidinol-phosphate transaminase, partial [bacterium]|nr:histidinol-phosphate transaminase [bacterium]
KEKPIKITIICNPNNPPGTVYSQELIVKIVKATSGIVLVDEAYREFYGKTAVPLINKFQNIVVLRSFSKFGGMAGARIGYLIASKDLSQIFDAIRFPLGVSMFSAQLAEILLKEDQSWIKKQITLVQKERERFIKELSSLGIYCFPSQSNFILARIGSNANNVCEELKKRNILVRNRSNKKYLEGCIRITIRNPEQNNILINNLKQIYD